MPDLTRLLMPRLQNPGPPEPAKITDHDARRLRSFPNLGQGSIQPAYAGQSILNLPSSICRILGAPGLGAVPLIPEILDSLAGPNHPNPIRRVILILIDALSLHRLQMWVEQENLAVWKEWIQAGLLAPLTSIVPSTTSAALTSLWTGRSTAEHGIAGYELWLKEYGLVTNMILHAPMSFQGKSGSECQPGSLACAGFQPETFLQLPTLGSHLAAHNITTYALQHASILHSGISRMLFRDASLHSFNSPTDLLINLRQLLESTPGKRQFIWVYWGDLDHLSHHYGPDDERPRAEFIAFSLALERLFLSRLSQQARRDTLLILTADHGQIATRPEPGYDLRNHPNLTRRLHIYPTGENRLAYLYIRPGQRKAVREYLERTWPGAFTIVDPVSAVEAGLFGLGPLHPRLYDRLGDDLVLSNGQAYLWWSAKENHLLGRHGGLSPEEMLVPFLAVRL